MTVSHKNPDIIPAQRLNLILELIRRKGVITTHELSEKTGVSLPTVRRDLDRLAETGKVQRSHGGATLSTPTGTTHEPDWHISASIAIKEKTSIGKQAAERLRDKQSVIFDSSSTVFEAARQVVEMGLTLTAVTNDLRIGELLANSPSINLIVSGGSQRPGSYTLLGEPGTSFLQNLNVDVALMGIHAVKGASCCDTSLEIAYAKRYMVASAKRVIVLADASKFGKVAFFEAFEVNDRFEMITDSPLEPSVLNSLVDKGVKVTIAGN